MTGRENYPWYRKSHRSWFVCFQGQQVRLGADKEAAFLKWHRLEAGQEQPPAQGLLLSTLIDRYLDDAEQRMKPSTMITKRAKLGRLKAEKGEVPAERFDAAALLDWIRSTRWGQSTRWLAAGVVKAMMRWGVRQELLKENPVESIEVKPPLSRSGEAIVTPEIHARILSIASPKHRDILTALWETGCRPSEVCRVEARHFDPAAACWRLDVHKTDKTGRERIIFLSPIMVDLCKRLAEKNPSGALFRNRLGKPFTANIVSNWFRWVRRRLGLPRVIAYGYRHGFATSALASGVPDAQVAELLGHSGTAMLHKHYAHLGARADALRSALGRVR